MANFCENCGTPLNNDDRFCSNCGAPVTDDEEVSRPVAPAVPRAPRSAPSSAPRRASGTGGASPVNPATGAASAATVGAFRPQPAPERPQESFVPPQQQPRPAQQPMPDNYSRPVTDLYSPTRSSIPHRTCRKPITTGRENSPVAGPVRDMNRTLTSSPCSFVMTTG